MVSPAILAIGLCLLMTTAVSRNPPPGGTGTPTVPVEDEGHFLVNLSAPVLTPGGSGPLGFQLFDPLSAPLDQLVLNFTVYAFETVPASSSSALPPGGSPVLTGGLSNGTSTSLSVPVLLPNASLAGTGGLAVDVSVPTGAPSGTFAVRTALSFLSSGVPYLLESRGYFSAGVWANATLTSNATPTLNASRLGISGILPETAILVRSDGIVPVLDVLVGGAAVLAAAGGYAAVRRGPGSRSGAARPASEPRSAESAFGSKRTNDGD